MSSGQRLVNNTKQCFQTLSLQSFLLFVICVLQFIYIRGFDLSCSTRWQTTELTFNYSYGFIKRGLLGTIVSGISELFNISFINAATIFQAVCELIFTFALIFLFMYCQRKVSENLRLKSFCWILMFFLFAGAGSHYELWGEPDIVMVTLTAIICLLILKEKARWLVPLLCAVCVTIHEGYALMYFSLPMALLLYKILNNNGNRKKLIAVFSTTLLLISGLFIYFYFFAHVSDGITLEQFAANSTSMIGEISQTNNIEYTFFGGIGPDGALWLDGKPTIYFLFRIVCIAFMSILLLPVELLLLKFFRVLLKSADTLQERLSFLLCGLGAFSTVPLFLVHTDTGRWMWDVIFYYFALVILLLALNDRKIKQAFNDTMSSFSNLTFAVILIYLAALSTQYSEGLCSKLCYPVIELIL